MSEFPAGKEPIPPLLRLPRYLRNHIYRFVGLASWNGARYTFDLGGRDRANEGYWVEDKPRSSPRTFHGLLLSCRSIYAEAAALLYSANRFTIHYTNPESLAPLLSLTASALSSLSSLKVVLNHASCHQRTRSRDDLDCCTHNRCDSKCQRPGYHRHRHQPPLFCRCPWVDDDDPLGAAQAVLSEWCTVASRLSRFVIPTRLELGLVCDIDPQHEQAVELAKSLAAPLHLFPSRLRSCHIRLGKTPDPRLSQVAQDAVLKSVGSIVTFRPSARPNIFLALPREVRVRILEFTDLVTPNREVWWCREDSKYRWKDIGGHSWGCEDDTFTSPCQFWECWYRTFTNRCSMTGLPIGCFCRRRHAASSTTCTCWICPGPSLFLVCRTIYQDAQLVFFSANRFIIHDFTRSPWALSHSSPYQTFNDGEQYPRSGYPFQRLTASHFLREVVPAHCIAYLRFLELVFPPYFPSPWPKTNHPAMQDWRDVVGWLQDKINGPALTLRVVTAECGPHAPDSPYTDPITMAQGDAIYQGYLDLIQPLEQLTNGPNGLARFYTDLRYPWEWADESRNRPGFREWMAARKIELDRSLERRVLGGRYDQQYANGKKQPEKSLWGHVYYYHY